MYTSWPWWTAKGNFMLATVWYIMDLPQTLYGIMGRTAPRLAHRTWLCFSVVLIFLKHICWSPQFGSLKWPSLSSIQLIALWILICLKNLWGLLSLWPEQVCLQGYGIIVICTASSSCWTSCTDPWIIFAWKWYLILRKNYQLLPWSFWLIMCMLGGWSVCLAHNVLDVRLFLYEILDLVLCPCFLHLICS